MAKFSTVAKFRQFWSHWLFWGLMRSRVNLLDLRWSPRARRVRRWQGRSPGEGAGLKTQIGSHLKHLSAT